MKKLKLLLLTLTAFIFVNTQGRAQDNCVHEGSIIVDAFYGYPYYNGVLLKALATNSSNISNTNHLGGKIEYMISDKIGLGVEATYADVSVNYVDSTNRTYKAGISKLRVLGKMNVHFATNEHVDPYFTVGIGVKRTTFYDNNTTNGLKWSGNLVPVAIRIGVGVRYFFTDVVGINAEVGLGGPLVQGGLSFKF